MDLILARNPAKYGHNPSRLPRRRLLSAAEGGRSQLRAPSNKVLRLKPRQACSPGCGIRISLRIVLVVARRR